MVLHSQRLTERSAAGADWKAPLNVDKTKGSIQQHDEVFCLLPGWLEVSDGVASSAGWVARTAIIGYLFNISFPYLVIFSLYTWSPCRMTTSSAGPKSVRESIQTGSICVRDR